MWNPRKTASRSIKHPDEREQSKAFLEKAREISAERATESSIAGAYTDAGLLAADPSAMAKARHSGMTFKTFIGDLSFDKKGDITHARL